MCFIALALPYSKPADEPLRSKSHNCMSCTLNLHSFRSSCQTAQEFVAMVELVALQMDDADSLLKTAFSISFQRKHTSKFDEQNQTKVTGIR